MPRKKKSRSGGTNVSVWCICRQPDDGRWMIGCDKCDDWFHGSCVGVAEEKANEIKSFVCPNCAGGEKRIVWAVPQPSSADDVTSEPHPSPPQPKRQKVAKSKPGNVVIRVPHSDEPMSTESMVPSKGSTISGSPTAAAARRSIAPRAKALDPLPVESAHDLEKRTATHKKMVEILKGADVKLPITELEKRIESIAMEIENGLWSFGKGDYNAKVRSLRFNLTRPWNESLLTALIVGSVSPTELISMAPHQFARKEDQEWRAKRKDEYFSREVVKGAASPVPTYKDLLETVVPTVPEEGTPTKKPEESLLAISRSIPPATPAALSTDSPRNVRPRISPRSTRASFTDGIWSGSIDHGDRYPPFDVRGVLISGSGSNVPTVLRGSTLVVTGLVKLSDLRDHLEGCRVRGDREVSFVRFSARGLSDRFPLLQFCERFGRPLRAAVVIAKEDGESYLVPPCAWSKKSWTIADDQVVGVIISPHKDSVLKRLEQGKIMQPATHQLHQQQHQMTPGRVIGRGPQAAAGAPLAAAVAAAAIDTAVKRFPVMEASPSRPQRVQAGAGSRLIQDPAAPTAAQGNQQGANDMTRLVAQLESELASLSQKIATGEILIPRRNE